MKSILNIIPVSAIIFVFVLIQGCSEKQADKSNQEITKKNTQVETTKQEVQQGDTVQVQYTGKTKQGEIFDQSEQGNPLEFEVGSGKIIPGFENAVIGMRIGEEKTVTIKPKQAYGERQEDLKQEVSKSSFPENFEFEKGKKLTLRTQSGTPRIATIEKEKEESVTVDLNHPLAGKTLVFDIQVVEIK
ncbi:MAG: FKBP-type peptidyl-prolyl cis-trans isomerase [Elusimicrobiota bacterium]